MDRQYGVRPGSGVNGTPPPPPYTSQPHNRRSQSPLKRVVSPFEDHSQASSYTRSQRAPYSSQSAQESPPPPPAHRSMIQHPTPPRQAYGGVSLPGSEVSLYSPQDSRARALQGVDSLYSPRLNSPSPERDTYFHSPYRDASPPVKQAIPRRPVSKTPVPMAAPLPIVSPIQHHRDSTPMLASHEQGLPRSAYYHGDGYDNIDPNNIADDPDDVFQDPTQRTKSRMSFARPFSRAEPVGMGAPVAAAGLRHHSGAYHAVSDSQTDLPEKRWSEKSDWLEQEQADRRRRKRVFIILGVLLVIGIIVGVVVGAIVATRKQAAASTSAATTSSSSSSSSGTHSGGLYDINSKEIQAVLGNSNLHKVFPGMDYTPLNSQYPDCLQNPPDQNNVTLDIAVLSQLTPAVRLYGTDCGQTEAVLTAIDRLNMNDTMQVWLGVWLGNNITTNNRQLAQMYNILDKYPVSHFAGIIIGNEVLFREDLTLYQLSNSLTQVRTNLTSKKIALPLATSDLGDNWTAGLAATSDIIMANIHPFFAGVTPDVAPGWTWNFWQTRDSALTPASTGSWPKSIISEVGWPSEGGNDCGTGTSTCAAGKGAVASIDNMNTFMNGFICQSLTNGTTFFWFSAFDEPWKAIFNTASDQWESHWGLMDVNRNLKSGLSIPDCGGKTVSKAY